MSRRATRTGLIGYTGSIPTAYYSTSDIKSFNEFLSKTDILVASLPSTPQTHYLLKAEHFSTYPCNPPGRYAGHEPRADDAAEALRKNSIFINVGRGDLVSSGKS
jgi:phosphoglycerate dehydrogenase-like enzyme